MLLRIDHVVHPVRDLEAALRQAAERDLPFRPGGVHPVFRSRNALLYWDLTYWELLAFDGVPPDEAPAFVRHASRSLSEPGELPTTFGLSVRDLESARRALAEGGLDTTPPAAGQRTTPQGVTLRWWTSELLTWPAGAGQPPFLIQHAGDDAERRLTLARLGFLPATQTGSVAQDPRNLRLAELRWPVPDVDTAAEAYRSLARLLGGSTGGTPDPHRGERVLLGPAELRPASQGSPPEVHLRGASRPGGVELLGVRFRWA